MEETLTKILNDHKLWLGSKPGGKKADLSGMDLSGIDLSGMDLSHTNFTGADLTNAKLSHTKLAFANLYRANLTGAELACVNLSYATLKNAILIDTMLDHVLTNKAFDYYSFVAHDTSRRTVHCIKHDNTWMVQAGCFWGTLKELEVRVKNTHNSKVYLANIELLRGLR